MIIDEMIWLLWNVRMNVNESSESKGMNASTAKWSMHKHSEWARRLVKIFIIYYIHPYIHERLYRINCIRVSALRASSVQCCINRERNEKRINIHTSVKRMKATDIQWAYFDQSIGQMRSTDQERIRENTCECMHFLLRARDHVHPLFSS